MGTTPRQFRIPDDVWNAAHARAEAEHRTMTDAVVRLLRAYGTGQLDAERASLASPAPERPPRKPGEPESAADMMAALRKRNVV